MKKSLILFSACILLSCQSRTDAPRPESAASPAQETRHPNWVKNANIYEVNVRQYTPEGTFEAFSAHLPRLKELGVDILWFMPIQPIGLKNRKTDNEGDPGSYYSISDYTAVHPDLGTVDDFRQLVDKAHEMGMYVLLDWVANHTAFDHHWVAEHPEFYSSKDGQSPVVAMDNEGGSTDWTDVADLNYDNEGLHEAMFQEMAWWVNECDIDGFRCDVAGFVPFDFWNTTRPRLEEIKPLFMLAEWEDPRHMEAFNMNYGWEFHHIMNEVANGRQGKEQIKAYLEKNDTLYSQDDIRMYFTTNHDENSWNGTVFERMGPQHLNMFVLGATLPGMPLIYSGQEAGLDRKLSFFGKDSIDWANDEYVSFYRQMLGLKHDQKALWNGKWGGSLEWIETSDPDLLFYKRKREGSEVWVLLNLSNERIISIAEELTLLPEDGLELLETIPENGATSDEETLPASAHRIYVAK